MRNKSLLTILALFGLALSLLAGTAQVWGGNLQTASGTEFTYQGRLTDGGAPANGTYDFEFKLFDDLSGGSQVSKTVPQDDVTVSDGLFTVQLDFGNVFDGTALYLEIGVRPGASSGAYTTLTPRQSLTAAPYAIYAAAAPWSGLSGVPPGFADGVDNGSSYHNVVIVAQSGGDFTTITAALDSINDASASNRYLVWVAPGTYTESVIMKEFVDIEGAGELMTWITFGSSGGPMEDTGTVWGANNAELRFLTVENTGGGEDAIAISNSGTAPRLTHVTAIASGGTGNYGVFNYLSSPTMTNVTASASGGTGSVGVYNGYLSSPTMTNVTASASGGTFSFGVYNGDFTSPTMTNVTASASGGTYNFGVCNHLSSPTMTNVIASASGGTDSYGVSNESSSPTINNSTISASGGTNNYGISNSAPSGAYTVLVNNSQISGSTYTIYNTLPFTTRVGASQLSGGTAFVGGGTITCAGVYDEAYTFYASTCP